MKHQRPEIPSCSLCTAGSQLFCHMSEAQAEIMSQFRNEALFRKGALIFREGERPNVLYCIHKGKVKLSKLSETGREQVVRLASEGDLLGYRAMFADEDYSATATALEECEVCVLSKERFWELMEANPAFNRAVLALLAKDVRAAEAAMTGQSQKGARARVADALIKLNVKFGTRADGKTLAVTLSRQEIADLGGVAVETAIRTLWAFSAEGCLALHGKDIQVLSLDKLKTISAAD